ncbi:MAG: PTS system mannose/fructose/sorbose family transporter subunit IID [Deltaproteobacteria bacterium]|nr:PTS system mannose/fructose/sorbose family transporter subunit IID [Deltaproteobacteria bacterium]
MSAISPRARRSIWRRQFLIQGCWNYEGMQNVGFAYAILPALREIYFGRPEEALKSVKRHLEFFNTHPVMGAVVLGAGVRLEERAAAGEADPGGVGAFKLGWMGSLGAIGDSFFWGSLRPMASVAGALIGLIHPLAGIATLLVLYNVTHLAVRHRGFSAGMEGEDAAVEWLKKESLNVKTGRRKLAAALLGGVYAGIFTGRTAVYGDTGFHAIALFLIGAAAIQFVTMMFRKAVSPSEILSFLLLVGVLILWQ